MPTQSGSYATPRLDLGAAFQEFDLTANNFIAALALPQIRVPRKEAKFVKLRREGVLARADLKRAARSAYNRDEYSVEDDSYACEEYGHEQPLDDSERAFYANDFDAEFYASQVAARRLLTDYEVRAATAIFNTSTWTGSSLTTAVGTEWSTASADAKSDILAAKEKVRRLTGVDPDTMIISKVVYNNLLKNDDLNEAVKYIQLGTVSNVAKAMADFFGLRQVLIGAGVYNSAKEGQDATITDIWDDEYAMICKLPEGDAITAPGIGRTFLWRDDSPNDLNVEEYREEQTRSTIYRVRHTVDEKIIDAAFGHLLSNITA